MELKTGGVYAFGQFVADENRMEVRRGDVALDLEPKALRVLFYLIRHHERVVSKEQLMAEVWAGTFVTDNALTRVVAQLRKQLGDSARKPRFIETSATTGYRFIAKLGAPISATALSRKRTRITVPAVLLAVTVAGAAAWLMASRSDRPVQLVGLRQATTSAAADLWPTFSPDGSQIAFSSNRSGVFEIYVRSLAPGSVDRQVTTDKQENLQPAWSPDGLYLAYVARRKGGIAVVPVSGGAPRQLTEQGDSPNWSPDGKRLAFRVASLELNPAIETSGVSETTIWVVGADGAGAQALTHRGDPGGGHNSPHWSPDGRKVVFASGMVWAKDGSGAAGTWWVDPANGKVEALGRAPGEVRSPVISPDSNYLFYAGAGGRNPGLWRARISQGRAREAQLLVAGVGSVPRDVAISPDGKRLAFSQQTGESAIWSVPLKSDGTAASDPSPLIRERSFRNAEPVFSPDGERIAWESVRQDGEGAVYLANADGSNAMPVTPPDQHAGRPAWVGADLGYGAVRKGNWSFYVLPLGGKASRLDFRLYAMDAERIKFSRDGKKAAGHVTTPAGSQVVVEDLATHEVRRITPSEKSYGFPVWSPDAQWLMVQDRRAGRNQISLITAQGGEIRPLPSGTTQALAHSWSPDSKKVAFAGLDQGVWNVYWIEVATGRVRQLTHFTSHSAFVRYPSWSPKGDQIVFENNGLAANIYIAELK